MRCKIPNNDLSQRLDNTICRFRNYPYKVHYLGGRQLDLRSLKTGKTVEIIDADDPDFDISTIPLGYVQVSKGRVVYTSRKPARIYKQGLGQDCVKVEPMMKNNPAAPVSIFTENFENMILGVYPTLEAALKLVKMENSDGPNTQIAVSRDVALLYNPKLELTYVYFKNEQVGFIINGSNTVVTPNNEMGWIISKHLSELNWRVE